MERLALLSPFTAYLITVTPSTVEALKVKLIFVFDAVCQSDQRIHFTGSKLREVMKVAERTDPKFSKDVCYSEADNLASYRDKYRFRFVFKCCHTGRKKKGDCLRSPVTAIEYTEQHYRVKRQRAKFKQGKEKL